MLRWADNNLLDLKWEEIGEHYGRYRLHVPGAERAMARSLERYGQLSPVVVCRRQDRYELIDVSNAWARYADWHRSRICRRGSWRPMSVRRRRPSTG